ncbi:MAG TPA: glycosyltransferase family 39 protein [Thermoanaerobaculia bacterium]|nr:glycosyltransferase family 39 protein [Thermoanaerobaculia bacterium]
MTERAARIVVACAIALIAIGGVALLCIDLRTHAAKYSPDQHVTAVFLDDLARRARNCGVVVLALAALAFFFRAAIADEVRALPRPRMLRVTIPALIAIAAGIVTRVVLLDAPLHWDEAYTFNEFVPRPLLDSLSRYAHPNNHLFHTLLDHVVYALGGDSRWALRLPAFVAGVAVLVATYVLARRLSGENAAVLSTGLAAAAWPLVEYSAEGRGYTMVALATLLLFLTRERNWLLAATLAALGAWTIPVMLFPFAAWLAWLLLERVPVRRIALIAAATGALTFLLYVPVLVVSGPSSITSNGTTKPLPLRDVLATLPASLCTTWREWNATYPLVLAIALIAGVVLALLRVRNLVLACVVASVPLALVLRVVPFPRVWVPFLPLLLIAAACGLTRERWRRTPIALTSILLALLGLRAARYSAAMEEPSMADVPAIGAFLNTSLPPDTIVLVVQPLDQPLAFEFRDRRLVRLAFDTTPESVHAALLTAPHTWAVLSPGAAAALREMQLPPRRVIRRFPKTEVVALR